MGHTKEPWEVKDGNYSSRGPIITINKSVSERICEIHRTAFTEYTGWSENALPNAERIVTCVNACAGLTNDEVKRYGPEIRTMLGFVRILNCGNGLERSIARDEAKTFLSRIEKEVV